MPNFFQRQRASGATQAEIAQKRFDQVVSALQAKAGRRLSWDERQRIWVQLWQRAAAK